MTTKRYSSDEVNELLRRALEIQRIEGSGATARLSQAQIEEIAEEVGLAPEYVRRAALELAEKQSRERFHLLGGPTTIDLERIIEGEMSLDKWDEMLVEMRRVFGGTGKVREVGRAREWVEGPEDQELVHVTVTPVGAQTRIRVSERLWVWAVSLHVPFAGLAVAPIALQYVFLDLGAVPETGIALGILATFQVVARTIFGGVARRKERTIRRLLDQFDELVARRETTTEEDSTPVKSVAASDEDGRSKEDPIRRERARLAEMERKAKESTR